MGRKSRVKGNVWMREVARLLREQVFAGMEIHKGDQGRKGSDAGDVDAPDLPVWIECKHGATTSKANPYKAVEQALGDSRGKRPAVAFCKVGAQAERAQRHAPIMAVPMDFGLKLLTAWWAAEKVLRDFDKFVGVQRADGKIGGGFDPAITAEMPVLTPPPVAAPVAPGGPSAPPPAPAGAPGGPPGAPDLPPPPPLPPGRRG